MKRLREEDIINDEPDAKAMRVVDAEAEVEQWLPMETWREIGHHVDSIRDWLAMAGTSTHVHKAIYSLLELRRRLPDLWADPHALDAGGMVVSRERLPDVLGIPFALGVLRRPEATDTFLDAIGKTAVVQHLQTCFRSGPLSGAPLAFQVCGGAPLAFQVCGGAAASAVLEALRVWAPTMGVPLPSAELSCDFGDIDIYLDQKDMINDFAHALRDPHPSVEQITESTVAIPFGRLSLVPWRKFTPRSNVERHRHHPDGECSPLCCFDLACSQFGIEFLVTGAEHAPLKIVRVRWRLDALCGLYTRACRLRNWNTDLGLATDMKPSLAFPLKELAHLPYRCRWPFNDAGRHEPTDDDFPEIRSHPIHRFVSRVLKYADRGYRFPRLQTCALLHRFANEADRIDFLRRMHAGFDEDLAPFDMTFRDALVLSHGYGDFFENKTAAFEWLEYIDTCLEKNRY